MASSWKNKRFTQPKKSDYDETAPVIKGITCEFCAEKPINKCERCLAEVCPEHTKEIKIRYPPWYKNYCQDCYKRHWLIRIISIASSIAVFLIIALVPQVRDFFSSLGGT